MTRVDVMRPFLGAEEIAAVTATLESGWLAQGPKVAEFESVFAARMDAAHAVAVSSCTTALHLALVVAGIGAGDDVVVPSLSFVATANAVRYVGARPVFADIDRLTGNVTPDSVKRVLTPSTRAVIAVDQGGVPVDLTGIRALCDPLGIVVVEDAACGAGSTHRGRPVGAGADIAAWSFHPRKILTTGEGGMITTSNGEWAARARALREHATSRSAADRHRVTLPAAESYTEVAFNYRMTDLQAAVGVVQVGRLDEIVARRREWAQRYRDDLAAVRGLRCVADPEDGTGNAQSFWVEVTEAAARDRDGYLEALAARDVSARRGIMAIHRQPAYAESDAVVGDLTVTDHLTDNTLILPLFHAMTEEQYRRVVDTLTASS
ncbi:DegT/DnrJ/EryC1/StrS family aminotransferase [Rhodococcoides corynebacterioides]|uniref:DegT/DnrJ/EryC1/StrS family aminotransferase n=1 Tax=Rhodococcoides corynebacterioides TaxID=53972 RepID=A0ABS7P789_9NOCA|nr:DegT/DnrJ/EryC1/StrS family aminotransferase [Rhodococcus corynebacterioides]MBY6367524.1 DegT/DnrJ/EryC1/StrS family aminotransferase [Rhodococcus corynebacterioides]MBY6407216.1 DegT/DnrJ/EryC1/StrS family aminotransferase [Rhodococcus corynebacterioides]